MNEGNVTQQLLQKKASAFEKCPKQGSLLFSQLSNFNKTFDHFYAFIDLYVRNKFACQIQHENIVRTQYSHVWYASNPQ